MGRGAPASATIAWLCAVASTGGRGPAPRAMPVGGVASGAASVATRTLRVAARGRQRRPPAAARRPGRRPPTSPRSIRSPASPGRGPTCVRDRPSPSARQTHLTLPPAGRSLRASDGRGPTPPRAGWASRVGRRRLHRRGGVDDHTMSRARPAGRSTNGRVRGAPGSRPGAAGGSRSRLLAQPLATGRWPRRRHQLVPQQRGRRPGPRPDGA